MVNERKGVLFVVSGPSGSGKTTLCQAISRAENMYYTISCTTRAMRPGEVHGEHYFFLTKEDFHQKVAEGEFLEYATVHGNSYGTLKAEVLPKLRTGQDVIMDLDPQGAAQIRASNDAEIQASSVDIFILPPSAEEFRLRLSGRQSETPEQVELRMTNAREEIKEWRSYDYALVSGTREADYAALHCILSAERMKASRLVTADVDEL